MNSTLFNFTHGWNPEASSVCVCIIELSQFAPLIVNAASLHFDLYVYTFTFKKNLVTNLHGSELIAEEQWK